MLVIRVKCVQVQEEKRVSEVRKVILVQLVQQEQLVPQEILVLQVLRAQVQRVQLAQQE